MSLHSGMSQVGSVFSKHVDKFWSWLRLFYKNNLGLFFFFFFARIKILVLIKLFLYSVGSFSFNMLQSLKSILERIPTATGLKDSKTWACLYHKKNVYLVRLFPEMQKLCVTLRTLSESFYPQDITIYYPSGNYHWIHSKIFKSLLCYFVE